MRKLRLFLLLATLVTCLASCNKGGVDEAPIAVSIEATSVSWKSGSQNVTVTATKAWNVRVECQDGGSWARVNPTSGVGKTSDVGLFYDENLSGQDRVLRVTLSTKTQNVYIEMTQTAKGEGSQDPVASWSGEDPGKASCAWLELPASFSGEKLEYYYHNMIVGGNTIRNYSYYWDSNNFVSRWVAYPLNKTLAGSGSRSDVWELDPNLSEGRQTNVTKKGFDPSSAFDRGHQIPSADRLANSAANKQTFYGTNMTPQLNDFNQNIWQDLEIKVRNIANALNPATDTLYVVTGCLVKENSLSGDKGVFGGYALDNSGTKVAIPTGYFKALLRYKKGASEGKQGYAACGIYLEHKAYGKLDSYTSILRENLCTIDELEALLGYNLFANLPDVIGSEDAKAVEAQSPYDLNIWF